MHFFSSIVNVFTDFLFPKKQKIIELESLSTDKFLDTLPRAEPLKDKYTLALFDYSHPLTKEVVWELKYNGNTKIADKLGEILYDVIREELENYGLFEKWARPLLVPVPISGKRRFERGWNQSELLCESIVRHDQAKILKYLPRQLAKLRHTESQTKTASRSERLHNIVDSMKILNPLSVAGECVIVIDDVTTTGSTFAEARRALKEAGAKKILCIATAH